MVSLEIARAILAGFDKHYRLFRETSARAKERFESGATAEVIAASRARIGMYDRRVVEAVLAIRERFPGEAHDEKIWPSVKDTFVTLLRDHLQPECAETFFNSVACRLLDRRYYGNEHIFVRPSVSTEHLTGASPTYRCYYPKADGLEAAIVEIVESFDLKSPFADLARDAALVVRAFHEQLRGDWELRQNFQVHVLTSLFYRNKAAYIVGRVLNGSDVYPFVVPILRDPSGSLYLDALLVHRQHVGRLMSLGRAYFMVDMEVSSAYVAFLQSLLPSKPKAELYTLVGLQKQGKTLFYRDLVEHLRHSTDSFVVAPGIAGMVMVVFTLPSFPYVFKVIRDWFSPPKDIDRQRVLDQYLVVKYHDRVGRLADTLEYSSVAFPLARVDPKLLDVLNRLAPSACEIDGDKLVLRHLYIERRMEPLDLYVKRAQGDELRRVDGEYGDAIRELAAVDIFPGDLLLKNFGVTRYGRVVFYDYDEICPLTDCNFRALPTAHSYDEEVAGEPWYSVGPRDVFPEELYKFVFAQPETRALFHDLHPELSDPAFWRAEQERIKAGEQAETFPYPQELRFRKRD